MTRANKPRKLIIIGALLVIASVASFYIFQSLDERPDIPRIVWALQVVGGKYWIPPLLGLLGIWQVAAGAVSMLKKVDSPNKQS